MLNDRPIDLARIAEVTDIQFVSEELVEVAIQCLADIAKEIESTNSSVGTTGAAEATPTQGEKESKPADEESSNQAGKDDSHERTDHQGATAPDSSNPTSSGVAPSQKATASHEESSNCRKLAYQCTIIL